MLRWTHGPKQSSKIWKRLREKQSADHTHITAVRVSDLQFWISHISRLMLNIITAIEEGHRDLFVLQQ